MGASSSYFSSEIQDKSLKDYFPSISPALPLHTTLEEGELNRSDSVTSIHNEMNDILNLVSRIIISYIKDGQRNPLNEASNAFDESHFLKKKYV